MSAWLFPILHHYTGTATGDGENPELQIPVEAPEEQMTDHMTLHQVIASMEEKDQKLLEYRYYQNKTQQETADLLGMTQVQVSRREKSCFCICDH